MKKGDTFVVGPVAKFCGLAGIAFDLKVGKLPKTLVHQQAFRTPRLRSVGNVASVAGVHTVEVTRTPALATIRYDETQVPLARLKHAIEGIGFDVLH